MASASSLSLCLLSTLCVCAVTPGTEASGGGTSDDLVPAAIDALLAEPETPFFGIPIILPAEPYAITHPRGQARTMVVVGDVNGDGADDFAVGHAPGSAAFALQVTDGATGETLWSAMQASPNGFRSLRGLAAANGALVAGYSSPTGRIESRRATTGRLLWSRELAAAGMASPANISAVSFGPDVDGDGAADVIVAGGAAIDSAMVLSSADGATLWSHVAGDVVYDARPAHDEDGDGLPELIIAGGDGLPFARLLNGADGSVIWDVPLDGPGSVVLPLDDVNGDGTNDVAVGQFNAPGTCLVCLSGSDGSVLWEANGVFNDVTALDLIGDLLGTGLTDIVVGSFDNAVTAVLALNGNNEWRREGTTNNGGSMLSVVVTDDLDGNGQRDVLTCSVDHRLYVMGGVGGQWMADFDLSAKATTVLALPDVNGDGRPEIVVGGNDLVALFDGAAGLADGPVVELFPAPLGQEGQVLLWAYSGTFLWGFVSTGTGSLIIPGWDQPFGLDLSRTVIIHQGVAPGAGGTPKLIPPFTTSSIGLTLYFQSASLLAPGKGLLSDVVSFTVRP